MRSEGGLGRKVESLLHPMSYLFTDAFARALSTELDRGYDVLHLEQLWGVRIGPADHSRTLVNVQYLFDIDRRGEVPPALKDRVLRQTMLRAERDLLKRSSNISAFSQRLIDRVAAINPGSTRFVVPLGVDTSLYEFAGMARHDRPTLGLIGSFSWGPTLEAGRRLLSTLWPAIKQRVPDARLMLVGRQAASMLGRESGDDVVVHQDVPDARPYFGELDVLLYAPPVGSGMKVKVLEAFALGTPVVTNEEGIEGIPAKDGVHVGIGTTDEDLVQRAVELLRDATRRDAYRRSARVLLETHCSPDVTLTRLERIYDSICNGVPQESVCA
jgi:glycosyltransferase involved in cell wall biosynthesis